MFWTVLGGISHPAGGQHSTQLTLGADPKAWKGLVTLVGEAGAKDMSASAYSPGKMEARLA